MKTTVIDKYILLYNSIYSNTILCSHVAPNFVLLEESVDTTFAVHRQGEELLEETMESGIADERSMPPFKCKCIGSAA